MLFPSWGHDIRIIVPLVMGRGMVMDGPLGKVVILLGYCVGVFVGWKEQLRFMWDKPCSFASDSSNIFFSFLCYFHLIFVAKQLTLATT